MFVKVKYFGYFPLGSDIKINNIEFMKSEWNVYKKHPIVYGKKYITSPFLQELFYVTSNGNTVFFVAIEWGIGHYHIFTVNQRQNRRLSKHIDTENRFCNRIAVHINKAYHSVRVYGRVVDGPRDINFKVSDSIFILVDTSSFADFIRYTFTNNGNDKFYLDVYNPTMVDNSESFILIGKADKIVWHWNCPQVGEIYQEYVLLDAYVELSRYCSGEKEVIYFH